MELIYKFLKRKKKVEIPVLTDIEILFLIKLYYGHKFKQLIQ